jgi:hypothetical protein
MGAVGHQNMSNRRRRAAFGLFVFHRPKLTKKTGPVRQEFAK